MTTLEIAFWGSLLTIAYVYVGYPLTLWGLTLIKRPIPVGADRLYTPKVSLLISVYNEEAIVEAKLRNSLDLDYPEDLLEIVVISDGSSDRTVDIVMQTIRDNQTRHIVLRHYEGRIGKTACLNHAVPLTDGEIIIFSDANSIYSPHAIRHLVEPFADRSIGFVTGRTCYVPSTASRFGKSMNLYAEIDRWTKTLESELGSCVGADGAMFAVRKGLYLPLKADEINDLAIPFNVVRQGFRGVLQKEACCFEETATDEAMEFQRQVRIAARTIKAVSYHRDMLNPLRFGLFAIELFVHKVCKLISPLFLLTVLATNAWLVWSGPVYMGLMLGQVAVYANTSVQCSKWKRQRWAHFLATIMRVPHTLIVVNAAIIVAWMGWLRGESVMRWSPTR